MAAPGAGGLRYRLTARLLHRQGSASRHHGPGGGTARNQPGARSGEQAQPLEHQLATLQSL
jgi:hypothetical protein